MEEKVSFADFCAAKNNKMKWEYFYNALTNKAHRYHKMAACEKMSRKRFVKLLMATGLFERDAANKKADRVLKTCGSYHTWWYHHADRAVWRIANRITPEERLLRAIFGDDHKRVKPVKKAPVDREKREAQLKKEYDEFLELLKKYPDCTDAASCRKAKDKIFLECCEGTGEYDGNGREILRLLPDKANGLSEKVRELSKIGNYFAYR